MRILCISDQVDPLVYSPRMRERFHDVDLVLSAGDLPMEYLGFVSSMLNRSLVFVSGNHDLGPTMTMGQGAGGRWVEEEQSAPLRREGAIDAGFRILREEGLIILGLPGSMLYNHGPNQYRELGMAVRIGLMVPRLLFNRIFHGRAVDIVLTHSAPRGIHDRDDPCHRGFRSFLWLMRVFKPRWLVHGHIHLYDLADVRISRYFETTVVNAFGHWTLDTEIRRMSGWYESLAEEDFSRARTRELLSRMSRLLDPERGRLLSFEEVVAVLKPGSETYVGMRAVALDLVVGSEGRYRDFNRHFLPRREFLRSRWVRVDLAHYQDVPLPPVRLYEIGGLYFVRDGNHRVSVARMRGQAAIDAEVTSLNAEVSLRPGMTLEELKRELLSYEKRRFYERTELGALTGNQHLDFTSPGRYDVIIEHILVHKYFVNQSMTGELSFGDALFSWHENVYHPIVLAIEEGGLLSRFPGRTASDLYVFIVQHWDELKRKYGLTFPLSEAARDYARRFGRGPGMRLRDRVGRWLAWGRSLVEELRGRQ